MDVVCRTMSAATSRRRPVERCTLPLHLGHRGPAQGCPPLSLFDHERGALGDRRDAAWRAGCAFHGFAASRHRRLHVRHRGVGARSLGRRSAFRTSGSIHEAPALIEAKTALGPSARHRFCKRRGDRARRPHPKTCEIFRCGGARCPAATWCRARSETGRPRDAEPMGAASIPRFRAGRERRSRQGRDHRRTRSIINLSAYLLP